MKSSSRSRPLGFAETCLFDVAGILARTVAWTRQDDAGVVQESIKRPQRAGHYFVSRVCGGESAAASFPKPDDSAIFNGMYDIIGDIHGHADELRLLLSNLGYTEEANGFRHQTRQAIFVGDFVDRGPKISEVLRIVRSMVSTGAAQAVMGNHEFNAIAYQIPNANQPGEFLRRHTKEKGFQHEQTLLQLGADRSSRALGDALEWFRTLPMTLDLDGIRVVHACWDPQQISVIESARDKFGGVTDEFMAQACDGRSPLYYAIEDVLKGKEAPVPAGHPARDSYGHIRLAMRTRWFEAPGDHTFRSFSLPESTAMPDIPLTKEATACCAPYCETEPPVFFGHYWMNDDPPRPLSNNVACVDYSIAKGGRLCAYRWDGERKLGADKFVCVPALT